MSLSIITSDNQNNTGLTAKVTGSDPASTNNLYVSPVNQGTSPLAWSLSGSRTGDGSLNLTVAAGYYFVYGAASSVGGAAALSPPVIGVASRASLAMQTQVELAIQARIQTLALAGLATPPGNIPAARVYRFDTPLADEMLDLVTTPCVIVAPTVAPETVQAVVNSRDDIGWPVNVLVLANFSPRQQGIADSLKKWREQIFRALRFQRLPTVPEVYTVRPEPQPILTWKPPQYQYVYSAITFRAVGRDPRGV